jgi:pSer/pThr/pTyr-binding forkhead associated (FHA) protein
MTKLVYSNEGKIIEEFQLETGITKIGRRPECDIRVDDTVISGHHFNIVVRPSDYMEGLKDIHIEDCGSTNGTLVNGKPITRQLFKHSEVAVVGSHEFMLVDEGTRAYERTQVILPEEGED